MSTKYSGERNIYYCKWSYIGSVFVNVLVQFRHIFNGSMAKDTESESERKRESERKGGGERELERKSERDDI